MNFQMFKLDSKRQRTQGSNCQHPLDHQASPVAQTVKSLPVVRETQVQSLGQEDPLDVGNLISGSSAFYKSSLNICKFTVHVLLNPGWRILSITLLACEMSAIVQ